MATQIPRLHQEHPLQQEVIFSRLAALYLPRIVQKFLDPPAPSTSPQWANSVNIDDMPLANAYGYALVHLNGNPYFYKYFRQPMFGDTRRNLIRVMLERLNERSQHWEARSEWNVKYKPKGGIAIPSMIFDFCQLLTSLLLFESEESIHQLGKENTVKQLLPFLKYWNDRYAAASLAQYSNAKGKGKESNSDTGISSVKEWPAYQLWMTLQNGTDEYELSSIRTARAHHGRMEVCAADSCKRAVATDGGPLLQCSQCGTVRYVRHHYLGTLVPY